MLRLNYILKDKTPIPCDDLLEWGLWMETADRRVAYDKLADVEVSTVFLEVDHSFNSDVPILFETMIFSDIEDEHNETYRYTTWEEAEVGHQKVLDMVKARRN
jgi:hypothetical protein